MSTKSDAGGADTAPADAAPTKGVHEDPNGVEVWKIWRAGWAAPVGHAMFRRERRSTPLKVSTIIWERWTAKVVVLSQPVSLLMLQGLSPTALFDRDSWVSSDTERIAGPFQMLQGTPVDPWEVPQMLHTVVLARLIMSPAEAKTEDVLSALLLEGRS